MPTEEEKQKTLKKNTYIKNNKETYSPKKTKHKKNTHRGKQSTTTKIPTENEKAAFKGDRYR